jgi:hypothetical protein
VANNALVGAPLSATGGVLSAPEGTALPTSSSAVTTGFVALGLIGEDGLSETADRSTEQIRAWGGSLARTVQTEFGLSYTFQFIETNPAVLREVHGVENVNTTSAVDPAYDELAIAVNKNQLPVKPYLFEVKDGENRIRIVIPNGQITAVGGVTYSHNDIIRYEVTLTCYADESGNEAYKYITGPAVDAA